MSVCHVTTLYFPSSLPSSSLSLSLSLQTTGGWGGEEAGGELRVKRSKGGGCCRRAHSLSPWRERPNQRSCSATCSALPLNSSAHSPCLL
uniref:Uncharacterized protein n=1 Tax=Oryza sativa subsp. japonica TaxID=39947 RepID=Q6K8X9_ORYSJ|nr:hypothetical protein [Oryza sativa Japonica Group]BAD19281.1 hypothetical protein [Oryza sativa Japonica Group]